MVRKILVLVLCLMTAFAACAEGTEEQVNVYVSITDEAGELTLAYQPVAVTDLDGDGTLTINDALTAAHASNHQDGLEAYAVKDTEFGLSMMKLWGVDNGGSYGYYLNHHSAWSLLDQVQQGDHVKAYLYTDLTSWSDQYCFFDKDFSEAKPGDEIPLTLYAAGYDEAYNPVTLPVAGASIVVNGETTEWKTDEEGKAVILCAEAGEYQISAESEMMNLVAPVCVILVKE